MKKWVKVGLIWGFTIFVMLVFVFPYFSREEITSKSILTGAIIWVLGGLLFGYLMRKNFKD